MRQKFEAPLLHFYLQYGFRQIAVFVFCQSEPGPGFHVAVRLFSNRPQDAS